MLNFSRNYGRLFIVLLFIGLLTSPFLTQLGLAQSNSRYEVSTETAKDVLFEREEYTFRALPNLKLRLVEGNADWLATLPYSLIDALSDIKEIRIESLQQDEKRFPFTRSVISIYFIDTHGEQIQNLATAIGYFPDRYHIFELGDSLIPRANLANAKSYFEKRKFNFVCTSVVSSFESKNSESNFKSAVFFVPAKKEKSAECVASLLLDYFGLRGSAILYPAHTHEIASRLEELLRLESPHHFKKDS